MGEPHAPWEREVTVDRCQGTLLMHSDGTLAACSEELEGRRCAGNGLAHAAIVACEDVLGTGGCELCSVDGWSERDWGHVVHLGRHRQIRARCGAHLSDSSRAPAAASRHS